MKRSDFLKRLGIGTAAIIATPAIISSIPKEEPFNVVQAAIDQLDYVVLSPDDLKIVRQMNIDVKTIATHFKVSPEWLSNLEYTTFYVSDKK